MLAQHADQDWALQRRCLDVLSDAVAKGDASPANLAYLTTGYSKENSATRHIGPSTSERPDRRASHRQDPVFLEERPLSAGIPPLADQERATTYGLPKVHISPWPVLVRCQNRVAQCPVSLPK